MTGDLQVVNKTRQTVLLKRATVADTFRSRLKGLLGRKSLPPECGLLIKPCRSVHSFGMRFSIDVGFVDGEGRLCRVISRMKPFRFSPTVKKAVYVIEAAAGTFEKTGTCEGDQVELAPAGAAVSSRRK